MNYSELLTKAWDTVWKNKFLIVLGMIAVFGSGSSSGRGSSRGGQPGQQYGQLSDLCRGVGPVFRDMGIDAGAILGAVVAVIVVLFIIGLALWALRRIAEGGMISGVNEVDSGRSSSFTLAFNAGWNKGWQLIGIGLVTAVPVVLLLIVLASMTYSFFAGQNWQLICAAASSGNDAQLAQAFGRMSSFWIVIASSTCLFVAGASVLKALQGFADRACMIENTGVLASYGRGWAVIRDNFGEVVVLFILQIAVMIALFAVLIVPSAVITVTCCCILWPLLWAVSGGIHAYFSSLWTLAWRQWTGAKPGEPVDAAPAPAV